MMTRRSPIILYTLIDKQYANREATPLTIKIEKGSIKEEFELGKPIREELEKVAF